MLSRYKLYTMYNSPYSDKIRTFMRIKSIAFDECIENAQTRFEVLQARTGRTMVPVIISPDDKVAINDSTPIAAYLEQHHPGIPTRWENPVADAVAMLLEDYADEWLVRIMLASRWYHEADAAQNAALIAAGMCHGVYGLDFQTAARDFPPGIVATLPKMGATVGNANDWYGMLPRILKAMDATLQASPFLTGERAHLVDAAFFGQLNQIRRDPTGNGWIQDAPESVQAWLGRIEDLCKNGGTKQGQPLTDLSSLEPLVREASRTYFRMAVANALAVESDSNEPVDVELAEGFEFKAPQAKYNAKMLGNDLDILEKLYGSGNRLPRPIEDTLFAELSLLKTGKSSLLGTRPTVADAL